MPRERIIFTGSSGLRIKQDPVRLRTSEGGTMPLAQAVNITLDDTGRISRRKGYRLALPDTGARDGIAVNDGRAMLYVVGHLLKWWDGATVRVLRDDLTPRIAMAWHRLGQRTFFTNGFETGIYDETSEQCVPWIAPEEFHALGDTVASVSPQELLEHDGNAAVMGEHAGRLLIGMGRIVWMTEPHNPFLIAPAADFLFLEHPVRVLHSLGDALLVGTSQEIFLELGTNPADFQRRLLASCGCPHGVAVPVDGSRLGQGELSGVGALILTDRGLCFAGQGGVFISLTEDAVTLPKVARCAGVLHADNTYMATLF